jgi:hypothetical protein
MARSPVEGAAQIFAENPVRHPPGRFPQQDQQVPAGAAESGIAAKFFADKALQVIAPHGISHLSRRHDGQPGQFPFPAPSDGAEALAAGPGPQGTELLEVTAAVDALAAAQALVHGAAPRPR